MIKKFLIGIATLFPFEAVLAAERTLLQSVIVNIVPILLFIGVWIYLMKKMSKGSCDVNERIIESNDRLTDQIKRIADHLEKNS